MTTLDRLRDAYSKFVNDRNCKAGRHRWTASIKKLEDGSALGTHICQSCHLHAETVRYAPLVK